MSPPANGRAHLSIGEVLSLLQDEFPDVTISKIRFLESQGLLDPERTPSGYRKFYESDIARLRWILRQQKEHYLPLKVIKDRLDENGGQIPEDADTDEPDLDEGGLLSVRHLSAQSLENGHRNGASSATLLPPRRPEAGPQNRPPGPPRSVPGPGPGPRPEAGRQRRRLDGPPDQWPDSVYDALALEVEEGKPPRKRVLPAPPPPPAPPLSGRSDGDGEETTARPRPDATDRSIAASRSSVARAAPQVTPAGDMEQASPATTEIREGPVTPTVDDIVAAPGDGDSDGRGSVPLLSTAPDVTLTMDELSEATGLSTRELKDLEKFGLIEALPDEEPPLYDGDALVIAHTAAGFLQHGIEARHLRAIKVAVEREAGLIAQVATPTLKQRNPEARKRAARTVNELMRLGEVMRNVLLRRAFHDL